MKQFKEFGIKPSLDGFVGDKIKINRVLNREVIIHKYRIVKSKFDGDRLDMQLEIDGTKHVLWTGSVSLMIMIKQVPENEFPFKATIVREGEHFEFR